MTGARFLNVIPALGAFLCVLIIGGCETAAQNGTNSSPLARCAPGWWLGEAQECGSICPGQPECDQPDCELRSVLGLQPDAGSVQTSITHSPRLKQFSAVGGPVGTRWSLDCAEGKISLSARTGCVEATCTDSSLSLSVFSNARASASLSAAFERASIDGGWMAVPY